LVASLAVNNSAGLTSFRNGRDDHDGHDARNHDVVNVAAVAIVGRAVSRHT
jgi:hypothetical protein